MVKGYVLVQTSTGVSAHVAYEIRKLSDGIVSVEDVTGPYDVIVYVMTDTLDHLGKIVSQDIQAIEGITRTLTCPVVNLG